MQIQRLDAGDGSAQHKKPGRRVDRQARVCGRSGGDSTPRGWRVLPQPKSVVEERRIVTAFRIVVELQLGLTGWLERQPNSIPFVRALVALRLPNLVEDKVSLVEKVNL